MTAAPLGDCQVLAARISQNRLFCNRLHTKGLCQVVWCPTRCAYRPLQGMLALVPTDCVEASVTVHPVPLDVLTLPDKKPALELPGGSSMSTADSEWTSNGGTG